MGNQQSFEQHSDFKDLQHNYTYEKKYNDSRFGEVKLLRENSTGQKIFQKDFSSNTPKEFKDYVEEIRDCAVLSHPNVLRVYGYNSKKEDLFCADFYKLSLFFESFDGDLEQEISRRSHNKDYFPEKELWYILDSVASGCAYLQNNKVPHRDIRPYNVFITPTKDYKISATNVFRQNFNPAFFEDFDALEAKSRYYSPELLQHFSKPQAKRTPIDEYKSDVFSLGMTMLEAGLLQKTPDVYNYNKFEVSQPRIQESLTKLRERYSENFVKVIASTLDFNPETRLDFQQLDIDLSRFRRDIREQARGNTETTTVPVVPDTRGTHLRMASPERPVRSAAPQYEDDLDRRVREAVRKSEEVIKRSSPTKYANKNLDPYIQSYLRNDLRPNQDQPLLSTISPYLTSESKYTTTLTIEQPNYGRESQPINFSQPQPSEAHADQIKRSAYVDLGSNLHAQPTSPPGGYTQPGALGTQSAASFGQPQPQPQTYGLTSSSYGQTTYEAPRVSQPESYLAGTSGLGNAQLGSYANTTTAGGYGGYGNTTTGLGQSGLGTNYGGYGTTTGLGQSGTGINYAGSNYGVSGGYGTPGGNVYATATGDASNRNYVNEADDLSRRIAERLQQSKQLTS